MDTTTLHTSALLGSREEDSIKIYPARWLALGVYTLHEIASNIMWITFSPITSIAMCYYDVTLFWINALSWINMLVYVVFLFPATWFLERFGLRVTAIVGGSLNAAGGWLRFAGSGKDKHLYEYNNSVNNYLITGPDSYWILLSGQFLTSVTYLLETNACSMLSAVWFPPHQRTIATTLFAIISAEVCLTLCLSVYPSYFII